MISLRNGWVSGAVVLALIAACGDDSTGGDADLDSDTDTGPTSATGDTGGLTGSSGTTTGLTSDPSGATAGSSTTSGPSTTTLETTTASDSGCPDGEMVGDECCEWGPGWSQEIFAHELTLTMTVNGAKHVGSVFDDAEIVLVEQETGDRVPMGRLREGDLTKWVLPGTYDVVYEALPAVSSLPRNHRAVIKEGLSVVDGGAEPINVESVEVALSVRVNDIVPPPTPFDDGMISVSQGDQESRTLLGKTSGMNAGELKVTLIAGSYDLYYESEDRQIKMPFNALARVGELSLDYGGDGDKDSVTRALNLEVLELSGDIFFDDEVPPPSPFDHGSLYLRDVSTGSLTKIADTADGSVKTTPVLAGSAGYDLFYAAEHAQTVPANAWGRLNTEAIMSSDETLSAEMLAEKLAILSIPTMSVTGAITVDGVSKPADPNNRGELLIGDAEGDRGELGAVSSGISSTLLRSGYDVFFRHDVSDGGLPINTFGRVQEEGIMGEIIEEIAVDIPTTLLSGKISINGATPPKSVYDDGEIFLRNAGGDRVFLGQTREGDYERRIVDGFYDVYYAVTNYQGGVPANHETKIMTGVEVSGGEQALPIDLNTAKVVATLPSLPEGGRARLFLRGLETGEDIFIGKTGEEIEVSVIPGNYRLVYRVEHLGQETPTNEGAVLGCYQLD